MVPPEALGAVAAGAVGPASFVASTGCVDSAIGAGASPVSYTHLTLPTNREV